LHRVPTNRGLPAATDHRRSLPRHLRARRRRMALDLSRLHARRLDRRSLAPSTHGSAPVSDALERLFGLGGKTALVTGGGQGIGRMIAQGLIEAGATVYIASRKLDQCEQTARELSAYCTCHALAADLATEDGCRSLVDAYLERESSLSILVNNS